MLFNVQTYFVYRSLNAFCSTHTVPRNDNRLSGGCNGKYWHFWHYRFAVIKLHNHAPVTFSLIYHAIQKSQTMLIVLKAILVEHPGFLPFDWIAHKALWSKYLSKPWNPASSRLCDFDLSFQFMQWGKHCRMTILSIQGKYSDLLLLAKKCTLYLSQCWPRYLCCHITSQWVESNKQGITRIITTLKIYGRQPANRLAHQMSDFVKKTLSYHLTDQLLT